MPFCPPSLNPYVDRSLVVSRYSPYYHHQHDSDPESYNQQPSLHASRSLPAFALRLQDPRIKCGRNLGWNIDWAVAFLVNHLDPQNSPNAANVLENIRIRASTLEKEGHALEIPFRIFNKLDEMLFAGHLKNAVYLELRKLHPDLSGATHTHGWGLDLKVKRVSIYLNKDALQQARSGAIIGTLIHHMIHAYFLIACGPQAEKETAYGRLAHGLHFGKIMATIKKLSGGNGRPLTSLEFGHTLSKTNRPFYEEYYYQQRKPYHRRRGTEKWYCSHCYSDVAALSGAEIDAWYDTVCKPLLALPETLRSSSVQIYNPRQHILEDSVLVPAALLENYCSIHRAFEKGGCRYLELNELLDADTVLRFFELLYTGSYSPDAKGVLSLGGKGPPVIKSPSAGDPLLLADIRMHKMGLVTGFDELKGVTLDRMYKHAVTYEDPVSLLAELYGCGEPDADLKTWTRKFLGRAPQGEWGSGSVAGEPSNLAKLECEMLGWKARFYDLLEGSSALKYEVGRVRRELLASGMYAPVPGVGALFWAQLGMLPRGLGAQLGLGLGVRQGGYLGLPWVTPEVDIERRAAAAAAAADPYLTKGLAYADDYNDVVPSWEPW
ncbi:uncharacterized protein CC84DRAFT_1098826 [Paraphaeosphaeria sporulosa]|uniref:SprT-like domain-containing protein n=1 Tax=Paraphaeosphaeria sporulosa TaxID=1460663 RepID=A0A177C414_9PLEO|nr:uncharacterized protein CC84DRAFT_1098826 [Paraphaeosphaeria sporulosa]OAG02373.1 hypothetical protein CC84DRAFT_1098826 [Paraphaeosphaeria sporulosa]